MTDLVVVKLGGGLVQKPGKLVEAGLAVRSAARHGRLVVVPGGGVFANTVRLLDQTLTLPATTAHWMAILGMDQSAHLVAAHTPDAVVVHDQREIRTALEENRIPVLAPYRWMVAADALPHRWEVTSDSIAAFVAGALDAALLILLKPVSGPVATLVDPCFEGVLPAGLRVAVVGADELGRLVAVVRDRREPASAG